MSDLEAGREHVLEWRNLKAVADNGTLMLGPQSGSVRSGQLLAVMGPSGAGKTTFLDLLSQRTKSTLADGTIMFDGTSEFNMRTIATYVEQDDALLGVLTVAETVTFAARLSLPPATPREEISGLVDRTLQAMGLSDVAHNRIGTPIQRGISGGQKRRVTIASAVVSQPKILLCDEPTSGLDSTTSYKVISSIKTFARLTNTIVVATIHQPNWQTFSLFDEVLFLSGGHCMYHGAVGGVVPYFESLSHPCPPHTNPADHVIGIINTDFSSGSPSQSGDNEKPVLPRARLEFLSTAWCNHLASQSSGSANGGSDPTLLGPTRPDESVKLAARKSSLGQAYSFSREFSRTLLLMERMTLDYRRNLLAYGVRVAMYAGMGFLLATIWVNLGTRDTKINDRLSVHFFSVAFLGFMSVAGIPSFLEERAVFMRERHNGLYGPGVYVIANSLVNIPFLFLCAVLFCVISYWAIGLHPGANEFFRFLSFLFIAIYIAEAQSVFVAAAIPIFVAALAIASFLNGLWMCVQGYFIRAVNLPRFWFYSFHWIDYQTFAFELLVKNDFTGLKFPCQVINGSCQCSYPSSLIPGECAVSGQDVLQALDIAGVNIGLYSAIMIIMAIVYRVLFYLVLVWRKK